MTENSLRSILGILLVFLHLGILGLVFITYSKGGFRFDEFTSPVGVIVPMFTGYTTVIMVYFSKNRFRVNDTSPRVTALFAFWSTVFPVLLFLALTISILLFATSRVFANFEEFKVTLTVIESVFSVYVAKFVYTLFEKTESDDREVLGNK